MRLVAVLLGLLAVIAPQVSAQISSAHAVLHPFYNSTNANTDQPLLGTVDFFQNNDGSGLVNITVKIAGLQPNKNYSLHVHQYGNLAGFLSDASTSAILTNNATLFNVGPHFNPFNQAHGCGVGNPRHAGDLGNVSIADGTNSTTWSTVYLQSELLDLGINSTFSYDSIIGRAVVLREFPDVCDETQLGGYLAVGVIGIDTNSKAVADPQPVDPTNSAPKAVALIFNTTSQKPVGYINFWTDVANGTHMSGVVFGFPPLSVHGIHVHASGNEDNNITIGTHWTGPTGTVHGLPPNANRHWGDLGNVIADSKGVITFKDIWAPLNLISVWNSTNSILGRAIAIHQGNDDGTTSTYGPRYIFGVIGLADTLFPRLEVPKPFYPTVARAQVILRPFFNNTNATTAATWPDAPLTGNITFTQNVDGTGDVNVTVVVAGLKGGDYGLHIHEWGNEANSFDRTTGAPITTLANLGNALDTVKGGVGGHFNPFNQSHGCGYGNPARHAGDVGNVTVAPHADADRFTSYTYTYLKSELLDLGRDQNNNNSIIGRTITLHDRPNPCDGSALGNWIAIGVIGIDSTAINDGQQNVAQQDPLPINANNNSPKANAVIRDFRANGGAGQIVGDIFFWSGASGEIRMGGAVAGFAPGSSHGVHIHQFGNENNNLTIGPHWAAPGQDGADFHQLPPYAGRHFGDIIGSVTADANGVVSFFNVTDGFDLLSLTNAANSIIGHSIAFHEFADTGSSTSYGPRFRFGVIGMVHPDYPIPTNFSALIIPPAGSTPAPTASPAPTGTPSPTPGNGTTTAPPVTNGTTTAPPVTNGTTTAPPTNGTGSPTPTPTSKPPNAASSTTVSNMVVLLLALAVVALL